MLLAFGQEVHQGTREDIVVFWTDGEARRAIVDCGYGTAHSALERVLRRFPGGRAYYENLRLKVGELAEPGTSIATILGPHRIGLMRPYIAGEPGPDPWVVCRERSRVPQSPVLCASLEDARSFARRASEADDLSRSGWQAFRGERLRSPIERLFGRRGDGSVLFRSELEEALSASRAKANAAIVDSARSRPRRRAA
jgi:hypothetical protein